MGLWHWFHDVLDSPLFSIPTPTPTPTPTPIPTASEALEWLFIWWPVVLFLCGLVVVLPFLAWAFFRGARYVLSLISTILWIGAKSVFIYMLFRQLEDVARSAVHGRVNEWGLELLHALYYVQNQVLAHPVAKQTVDAFSFLYSYLPSLPFVK